MAELRIEDIAMRLSGKSVAEYRFNLVDVGRERRPLAERLHRTLVNEALVGRRVDIGADLRCGFRCTAFLFQTRSHDTWTGRHPVDPSTWAGRRCSSRRAGAPVR